MKSSLLSYDPSRMLDRQTPDGLPVSVVHELKPRLAKAKRALLEDWKTHKQGWLGCPDEKQLVQDIFHLVKKFRGYKTCLVIGIGGSDLGARAAYQALGKTSHGMRLEFLGNPDPDEVAAILERTDWKTTIVNIISKSGDTLEPMAIFAIVWDKLCRSVGKEQAAKQVIATTDAEQGSLRAFATRKGLSSLAIPSNIGGRFSVLTAVGLFPAACAGIDIKALLQGAAWQRGQFQKNAWGGDAGLFAALHIVGMVLREQKIHVLMPYSTQLEGMAKWWRQLWAESLGKKKDRQGRVEYLGPTPVASVGAIDQHSQVQLYMEGPKDKLITLIQVSRFTKNQKIPPAIREFPNLAFLSGKNLAQLLQVEAEATSQALSAAGRPNGILHLSEISAETIGALFLFFELATGLAGNLLEIQAYDQPGVEAGKKAAYAILKA